MTDPTNDFDPDFGHYLHWQCLSPAEDQDQEIFLQETLDQFYPEAELIGQTETPVPCVLEDYNGDEAFLTLITAPQQDIHFNCIIATSPERDENRLFSMFPECDGNEVRLQLTHIHEWHDRCTATLEGNLLDGEPHHIAFVDTRYAIHQTDYEIGKTYVFNLAAMAFEVQRQEDTSLQFDGQEALDMYQKLGMDPVYEDDGSIKPFVIQTDQLVALLQPEKACPHIGEFQSPLLQEPQTLRAFDQPFLKLLIGLNPSPEGPMNPIPLYARLDLVNPPQLNPDDVLVGNLWLMGHLPD